MASARQQSGWSKGSSFEIKPGPVFTCALEIEAATLGLKKTDLINLILRSWYGSHPPINAEEQRKSFFLQAQEKVKTE